jgi:hypothetical protein
MFEPKFKERGLVRAVFVVSTGSGCISTVSREEAEKYDNIWAVGVWRRDDEVDLQEKLEQDFKHLNEAYRKICGNEYCGGSFTYEYRKYKR